MSLTAAIRDGVKYPELNADGKFEYTETVAFLERLGQIFKWQVYDSQNLGRMSKDGKQVSALRWYDVLLTQWMEGHGLRSIIQRALEYRQRTGSIYIRWQGVRPYIDDPEHRNLVFGDILETLEDVIHFRLPNYFLKFSNINVRKEATEISYNVPGAFSLRDFFFKPTPAP